MSLPSSPTDKSLPSSPTDKLPSTGHRVIYSPAKRSARDFVDLQSDDEEEDSDSEDSTPQVKRQRVEGKLFSKEQDEWDDQVKKQRVEGMAGIKEEDQDDDDVGHDDEGTIIDHIDSGVNVNDMYHIDTSGMEDGEEGEEEAELKMCNICGGTPCDWLQYESDIVEFATNNLMLVEHGTEGFPFSYPIEKFDKMTEEEKDEVKESHQDYKKRCFRYYVSCKYGKLGHGKRVSTGPCIENAIRRMFPNHDGSMVGYHSS
jgi:subtilisin family serine protease